MSFSFSFRKFGDKEYTEDLSVVYIKIDNAKAGPKRPSEKSL